MEHVLKPCPDVNNKNNRSALNVAVLGYGRDMARSSKTSSNYGFTVNPEDVNNCKLLHAAVEKGYLKIVAELLKYDIDVNVIQLNIWKRLYAFTCCIQKLTGGSSQTLDKLWS
jgi:hypothetical protein